jgi:hypothetical protein
LTITPRPQPVEHRRVDQMVRVRPARRGEDQHVALRRQRRRVGNEAPWHGLGRAGGVEDLAGEGLGAPGDRLADPAQPEDTDPPPARASAQRNRPVAHPHRPVVGGDPALDRQPQRDRLVGDILGQRIGVIAMRMPRAATASVDPVMADAVHRDDLQRGQPVEQRLVHRHHPAADDRAGRGQGVVAMKLETLGKRQFQRGRNGRGQEEVVRHARQSSAICGESPPHEASATGRAARPVTPWLSLSATGCYVRAMFAVSAFLPLLDSHAVQPLGRVS